LYEKAETGSDSGRVTPKKIRNNPEVTRNQKRLVQKVPVIRKLLFTSSPLLTDFPKNLPAHSAEKL